MIGVVAQVRRAFAAKNRLAAVVGFLLGGFVPVAIYFIAHREAAHDVAFTTPWTLVGGGLLYSAQTVFQWARAAFSSALKSLGFCLLLEGVMVTSSIVWLTWVALGYLVVINGVATACTLALGAPRKKIAGLP